MNIVIEQLEGLTSDYLSAMKEPFEEFVKTQLSSGLNLSRLDCIYIPDDYEKTIIEFQVTNNLDERGFTDNEMGTSLAKVITFIGNGTEKDRIFLHKGFFISLFKDDDELKQLSINTIHHELCHIHDHSNVDKMVNFKEEYKSQEESLAKVMSLHAMDVWAEFLVPRMCARTIDPIKAINIEDVNELKTYVFEKMGVAKEKYFESRNTLRVFHEVQLLSGQLLKKLSTLYGNYKGIFGDDYNDLRLAIDEGIDEDLREIWLRLKSDLDKLYIEYPDWKELSILNDLNQTILFTWNTLGIYPVDKQDGLYINVL